MPGLCNGKLLIGTSALKATVTAELCIYEMHTAIFLYLVLFVRLFSKQRSSTAGAWDIKNQQKCIKTLSPMCFLCLFAKALGGKKGNIVSFCLTSPPPIIFKSLALGLSIAWCFKNFSPHRICQETNEIKQMSGPNCSLHYIENESLFFFPKPLHAVAICSGLPELSVT